MILTRFAVLTILTLWCSSLSAQFEIKELQEIQVRLLKGKACDSILTGKEYQIALMDRQIKNYQLAVDRYVLKDSIYTSEKQYYFEQIRDRNKEIERIKRKNKFSKVLLIGLGVTSGVLFGYLMLSK
jgi:hypothetical protein